MRFFMTSPRFKHSLLWAAGALAFALAYLPQASPSAADNDILARSRAQYASLRSYADTGTVDVEYGSPGAPIRERHSFKTYYRAPRHFYFDFTKHQNADRFVIWSDDEAFHTWWQTTSVENTYPKGQGTGAFVTGAMPTKNSLMQVPPLLFSKAGLVGTLTEFGEASVAGTETVGGRPCHKLIGIARSVYPATGHVTNVRRTTVWIDVEALLVRKVFEDTPRGTPAGSVSRITTIFEPQTNPTLDDSKFRFTAPSSQR